LKIIGYIEWGIFIMVLVNKNELSRNNNTQSELRSLFRKSKEKQNSKVISSKEMFCHEASKKIGDSETSLKKDFETTNYDYHHTVGVREKRPSQINILAEELIEKRAKKFFQHLCKNFPDGRNAFIMVSHIVSNNKPFFETFQNNGKIAGVIPKPSSIDKEVYSHLSKNGINFLQITKEDLATEGIIENKISSLVDSGENLMILDIGGYFAKSLEQLNHVKNLTGIVEDTENGLQKYEKALKNVPNNKVPIFSIARSRLKSNYEDYLIGRSVAESTLSLLKDNNIDYSGKTIGIMGFGEVGRGASLYLKEYEGLKVQIYDINEQVMKLARKSGFLTVDNNDLLKTSDILICCTGNKCLKEADLDLIKKDCYISSCTSSDDEFAFEIPAPKDGSKSEISNLRGVNFLHRGNAINFVDPQKEVEMVQPFINLTLSGLIKCCTKLSNYAQKDNRKVHVLSIPEEDKLISDFYKFMKPNNANAEFIERLHATPLIENLENSLTQKKAI
jgi:adenosylhomocysteinase